MIDEWTGGVDGVDKSEYYEFMLEKLLQNTSWVENPISMDFSLLNGVGGETPVTGRDKVNLTHVSKFS